ncbi:MAG TPA: phosphatidate cytidylyltransferase [Chloroflexota bacterium]|nr:phosphatidate cytidylyltransferase [Chloroflexota bacterium]
MKLRIATAIAWVPVNLAFLWLGDWEFVLWIAILAIAATAEILNLLLKLERAPLPWVGPFIVFAFLVGADWMPTQQYFLLVGPVLVLSLLLLLLNRGQAAAFERWALTTSAALYTGFLLGYTILLRQSPNGLRWMGAALLGTWVFDTGAYLVGRAWGRHHLLPTVSPGKTWEGAAGGAVVAMAAALSLVRLLHLSIAVALGLGLLIAVLAQLGDLVESLMKRQARLKDMSSLLPGHGGVLDRIDGLIFSSIGVYYFHLIAGH